MNLANAVYEFLNEKQAAADSSSLIKDAEIKENRYAKLGNGTTIRVSEVQSSIIDKRGDKTAQYNAYLSVGIWRKPVNQKIASRVKAAEIASGVALEIAGLMLDDITLGGRVCDVSEIKHQDDWGGKNTNLIAGSFLLIKLNQY